MKTIIAIITIMLVSVFYSIAYSQQTKQSYFNRYYNYSIQYPLDFIVVDVDNITKIITSNKISRTTKEMLSAMNKIGWNKGSILLIIDNAENQFSINIEERSSQMGTSYQQYIDSMRVNRQKIKYEVSEQNIQIDDVQGIQFVTTVTREGKKAYDVYNTLVPWNEYYFSISCHIASNEQGDNNLGIYKNILASFSFNK